MSAQPELLLSITDFLAFERGQQEKHEYLNGRVYRQAGASFLHNLVCANVIAALRPLVRGGTCRVYANDLRLKIPQRQQYLYADVTVIRGAIVRDATDADTARNPRLICEVVSPSTEDYDRGKKFQAYRRIPELAEYLLIAQDTVRIEHFVRQSTTM